MARSENAPSGPKPCSQAIYKVDGRKHNESVAGWWYGAIRIVTTEIVLLLSRDTLFRARFIPGTIKEFNSSYKTLMASTENLFEHYFVMVG